MEKQNGKDFILHMDNALRQKLESGLISEDDIRETIAYCKSSGQTVRDEVSGHLLGYAVVGHMTCWVAYIQLAEDEYRLYNTYSHRMAIDLEDIRHAKTDL